MKKRSVARKVQTPKASAQGGKKSARAAAREAARSAAFRRNTEHSEDAHALLREPERSGAPGSSGAKDDAEAPRANRRTRSAPERGASRRRTSGRSSEPSAEASRSAKRSRKSAAPRGPDPSTSCHNCSRDLTGRNARALYVEEEVGRIFCSEDCISEFFTPDIERLEKEYRRLLSRHDLGADEREALNHLRWLTLQDPDKSWVQKTLAGDLRYTLISEFMPEGQRIWSVCICLVLKGDPSFLYLSFPTRNEAMVDAYRRGEQIDWSLLQRQRVRTAEEEAGEVPVDQQPGNTDRLASEWTEDETYLAGISQERSPSDIRLEDYELYQSCMEETLEHPDEVWCVKLSRGTLPIYHFIRHYPDEKPGVWFVIVARQTDDNTAEEDDQLEILDAFPTKDPHLVEQYRRGEQEIGRLEARPTARVVHWGPITRVTSGDTGLHESLAGLRPADFHDNSAELAATLGFAQRNFP